MTSIILECKLNDWVPHGAKLGQISLSNLVYHISLAPTALAPMIGIGCFEWVDTVYINCIGNCTHFRVYSSICIYLLYAVRSAVVILVCSLNGFQA
jgi:hypothetical protein